MEWKYNTYPKGNTLVNTLKCKFVHLRSLFQLGKISHNNKNVNDSKK